MLECPRKRARGVLTRAKKAEKKIETTSVPKVLKVGVAAGVPPEEKRTYTYDARSYRSDVLIPAYSCIFFACVAIYCVVIGFFAPIAILALVVCAYTLNTFVAHAYPRVIELDATSISFESFGQKKVFALDRLEQCSLRSAGNSGHLYLRIAEKNDAGSGRGAHARYFIDTEDSVDQDGNPAMELKDFLLATEERVDPENIRVIARKQGR